MSRGAWFRLRSPALFGRWFVPGGVLCRSSASPRAKDRRRVTLEPGGMWAAAFDLDPLRQAGDNLKSRRPSDTTRFPCRRSGACASAGHARSAEGCRACASRQHVSGSSTRETCPHRHRLPGSRSHDGRLQLQLRRRMVVRRRPQESQGHRRAGCHGFRGLCPHPSLGDEPLRHPLGPCRRRPVSPASQHRRRHHQLLHHLRQRHRLHGLLRRLERARGHRLRRRGGGSDVD